MGGNRAGSLHRATGTSTGGRFLTQSAHLSPNRKGPIIRTRQNGWMIEPDVG